MYDGGRKKEEKDQIKRVGEKARKNAMVRRAPILGNYTLHAPLVTKAEMPTLI